MLLFVSKFMRIITKDKKNPAYCYAYRWLPHTIHYSCDCFGFCKFGPKGDTSTDCKIKHVYNKVVNN